MGGLATKGARTVHTRFRWPSRRFLGVPCESVRVEPMLFRMMAAILMLGVCGAVGRRAPRCPASGPWTKGLAL
eukprot:4280532-Alexandrium_andersonii.AAC.1